MWTTTNISFALLAILCVGSLLASGCAVRIVVRQTALPRAELRSLASRLQSIEQCQAEQADEMKVVANRVKMQRVRTAINHISDPPIADDAVTAKDRLRKLAGLTAGKPARHQ